MRTERNGMRTVQDRLARAERVGDAVAMARGYLILAGELCRSGDHRLCGLFIRKAEECLVPSGTVSGRGRRAEGGH